MAHKPEDRFRGWGDAHLCALSVVALWALGLISVGASGDTSGVVSPNVLVCGFIMAVLLPLSGFWSKALRDGKLPTRRADAENDGEPKYRHISGQSALYVIAFVALISIICAWAIRYNAKPDTETVISGSFGILVMGIVICVFIFFARQSYRPGRPRKPVDARSDTLFSIIGRVFSVVDSWLAIPVANTAGTQLSAGWRRYIVLVGNLSAILVLSWYLPGPLAFVPLGWAFLLILGITRQWAWVEDDREVAMLKRSFDQQDLRIGFAQDLRDEALIAYAIMLLIVPVALRAVFLSLGDQLDYSAALNGGIALEGHSYLAWMSLFGTELAKAVPFVDWAEIFHVQGAPYIVLDAANANYQLTVFATRVLVDLLLLAALVQAISIVSRTQKQKQLFFVDKTLAQLDPFIEPVEFRHLAQGSAYNWSIRDEEEFEAFPSYDEDRLEQLALPASRSGQDNDPLGTEKSAVRFIARKLKARDEARPPEYLLYLEVRRKEPNEERIEVLLEQVATKEAKIDVDRIVQTHQYLNRESKMLLIRKQLVHILASPPQNPEVLLALVAILNGSYVYKADRRKEVRELALGPIAFAAKSGHQIARQAIIETSQADPSSKLRDYARRITKDVEDWYEVERRAKKSLPVNS